MSEYKSVYDAHAAVCESYVGSAFIVDTPATKGFKFTEDSSIVDATQLSSLQAITRPLNYPTNMTGHSRLTNKSRTSQAKLVLARHGDARNMLPTMTISPFWTNATGAATTRGLHPVDVGHSRSTNNTLPTMIVSFTWKNSAGAATKGGLHPDEGDSARAIVAIKTESTSSGSHGLVPYVKPDGDPEFESSGPRPEPYDYTNVVEDIYNEYKYYAGFLPGIVHQGLGREVRLAR